MKIKYLEFTEREKSYLDKYQSVFCDNYKNITALNARIDILNLDYKDLQVTNLIDRINSMIKESFIFDKLNISEYSIKEEYKKALNNYSDFYYPKLSFKFPPNSCFNEFKIYNNFLYFYDYEGIIKIFKFNNSNKNLAFIKDIIVNNQKCLAYEIYNKYLLYATNTELYLYNFRSSILLDKIEINRNIIKIKVIDNSIYLYFDSEKQEIEIFNERISVRNTIYLTHKPYKENFNFNNFNFDEYKIKNFKFHYEKDIDSKVNFNEKNECVGKIKNTKRIFSDKNNFYILYLDKNKIELNIYDNNTDNLIKTIEVEENKVNYETNYDFNLSYIQNLIINSSKNHLFNKISLNFTISPDEKILLVSTQKSDSIDFYLLGKDNIHLDSKIKYDNFSITFSNKSDKMLIFINKKYYITNKKEHIKNPNLLSDELFLSVLENKKNSLLANAIFSDNDKYLILVLENQNQKSIVLLNLLKKINVFEIKNIEMGSSILEPYFFNNDSILLIWSFNEKTSSKNLKMYQIESGKLLKDLNFSSKSFFQKIDDRRFCIKSKKFIKIYSFISDVDYIETLSSFEIKHDNYEIMKQLSISTKLLVSIYENKIVFYNIKTLKEIHTINSNEKIIKFDLSSDSKKFIIGYEKYYQIYAVTFNEELKDDIKTEKIILTNTLKSLLGYKKIDNYISIIYKNEIKTFKHTNDGAELIYTLNSITSGGDYKKIPENMFAFDDGFIIKKPDGKVYGSKNWKDYVYFVDGDEIKDYPQWESYFEAVWDSNIFEEL